MKDGIYLFCIARSDLLPEIDGKGVDGRNLLFLHRLSDITAVVSIISLEDFCGESAESRMQDFSWVGPRAYRHEVVIEQVMRHSPVLPVRFGTIFSSLENLEKRLKKHRVPISRFLDQMSNQEEWSVKGFLDRAKAKEKLLSIHLCQQEDRLASLSAGMRYFEEKRIGARVEKELCSWLRKVCRKIGGNLNRYASEFCERKLLPRNATGSDGRDMILNWAFLVPRSAVDDFCKLIDRANKDQAYLGLSFELSGPWPPYSFYPSLDGEV